MATVALGKKVPAFSATATGEQKLALKDFKGKKNVDLWQRYLKLHSKFKLQFEWVKGHAGHPENERCDYLAVKAAEGSNLLIDSVFESENPGL